jgi:hypothetical protein
MFPWQRTEASTPLMVYISPILAPADDADLTILNICFIRVDLRA